MHPNLAKFLTLIGHSEGTIQVLGSDNGYNVMVGNGLFHDYSDHPRPRIWCESIKEFSSAAGKYQIMARFFDSYKHSLNLKDFSPDSQDKIALQMIKECHATQPIIDGNIELAIKACKSRWASLPGAGYNQHENKMQDLLNFYNQLS